jgi:hypothetical protein
VAGEQARRLAALILARSRTYERVAVKLNRRYKDGLQTIERSRFGELEADKKAERYLALCRTARELIRPLSTSLRNRQNFKAVWTTRHARKAQASLR